MAAKKLSWMSWSFVLENITKGMLQAVGAIILYAFVIIWIINKSDSVRAVLKSRLDPVMKNDSSSSSVQGQQQQQHPVGRPLAF